MVISLWSYLGTYGTEGAGVFLELSLGCMSRLVMVHCANWFLFCLTLISQTPPEGSQRGSLDVNVWSERSASQALSKTGKEKWVWGTKAENQRPYLPVCPLSSLPLPLLHFSTAVLILSNLSHYNLPLFPLFISYFQK